MKPARSVDRLRQRFYGDARYDGTARFYKWLRDNLQPNLRVLNLGAGPATGSAVRTIRGEVAELVGADVDPVVLSNSELDHAVLIADGALPLDTNSFDIVFSDYVLEHVEHPEQFLAEVQRVLAPGGSFFFRTPNVYHYVTLVSAATPHWFHQRVANKARGNAPGHQEPWPTYYRLNTARQIRRMGKTAGFSEVELQHVEAEPSYLRFSPALFLAGVAYERLVNSIPQLQAARSNIFGRMTK